MNEDRKPEMLPERPFSADRPKKRTSWEAAGFAASIADTIATWRGKDSLVLALHGEWSSGKLSGNL